MKYCFLVLNFVAAGILIRIYEIIAICLIYLLKSSLIVTKGSIMNPNRLALSAKFINLSVFLFMPFALRTQVISVPSAVPLIVLMLSQTKICKTMANKYIYISKNSEESDL